MALASNHIRAYLIKLLLVAAAYTAIVYVSLFLVPVGGSGASLVWPPAALGMGALFLFGIELWPALLLPFFFLLIAQSVSPPVAAVVSAGDMLEALLGALILRRLNFHPLFNRLSDALAFVAASASATLLPATLITLSLHTVGGIPFDRSLWAGLWLGHTVSLLSFGPFLIRWAYRPLFSRTLKQWIEGVLATGLASLLFFLMSWTHFTAIGSISLLYIGIIPLIWIALRMGPRGMSLSMALMALILASGVLFGAGAFAQSSNPSQSLFSVQLVVGTLSLIFLLFVSIVEERKEATNALQGHIERLGQALEQIRSEDQAKADFIAILAHELRNPLSPILSALEIMKVNGISEANRESVASIASHINIMARLLDDLLDLSRVSQKRFRIQREPLKLGDVVAQGLEMIRPHVADAELTLSTDVAQEDLWVDGDPVRLVQVVANLLSNAVKYTDPGGRVRLSLRRQGGEAALEVSDTGIGIDPERLEKIFEPFGASDSAIRRGGGLHIGLSLVKRMVEMHRGSLQVMSRPGRGSTFTVRLPLMPTAPLMQSEPRRSRFSQETLARNKRELGSLEVLVVDDNEAAAENMAKLLDLSGHRALIAYDGPQALELCERHTPAAALLDIGLPDMDGYELGRRLRQKFGDSLLMVALTGYGQAEDKEKSHQAGFDAHLIKPVSIVDVERVLLELSRES